MNQGETQLTGHLVEGVEGGCLVVVTDAGATFTLAGRASADLAGRSGRIMVRGRLDPEMLSHCMQGPVFVVTEVLELD
ncbi:hypothetical protein N802_03215 [Knoellia sinensis KCTC 19936]|uniref:Uncharacterized protein n=1 Tax=Knoellia sinensis KCTC 19936 TaxID=1385520 RepID=A0A0A0J4R4_9MICO|nr:hypothetical protein [Knoellia sinensis]KGN31734.1 hypothetical protein N802_03215 [Knoellia sinensis KCTC 19936]